MLSLKWMPEIYSFPLTDAQQHPAFSPPPCFLALVARLCCRQLLSVGCDTIRFFPWLPNLNVSLPFLSGLLTLSLLYRRRKKMQAHQHINCYSGYYHYHQCRRREGVSKESFVDRALKKKHLPTVCLECDRGFM